MPNHKYYAVAKGRSVGVFSKWADAEALVKGFPEARFRGFQTEDEAQLFVRSGGTAAVEAGAKRTTRPADAATEEGADATRRAGIRSETAGGTQQAKSLSEVLRDPEFCDVDVYDGVRREVVYVDGASRGNGQKGAVAGFGVYYGKGDSRNAARPLPASEEQTNNAAEAAAMLLAIERQVSIDASEWEAYTASAKSAAIVPALLRISPVSLVVRSDSNYVINSVTDWIHGWRKNGWKTKAGEPVKNKEALSRIADAIDTRVAYRSRWIDALRSAAPLPPASAVDASMADTLKTAGTLLTDSAFAKGFCNSATQLRYVKGHSGSTGNEAADRLAVEGAKMAKPAQSS